MSPGAGGKAMIGEPEHVVCWLAGEAGDCVSCLSAVEAGHGIAVGR